MAFIELLHVVEPNKLVIDYYGCRLLIPEWMCVPHVSLLICHV